MRKNQQKSDFLYVIENKPKKVVAFDGGNMAICLPMSPKLKIPEKITIRPKPEDYAIIRAGMQKHGLDQVQIIRMALRRFAESEKLQLAG